jgi:hypothetical protein
MALTDAFGARRNGEGVSPRTLKIFGEAKAPPTHTPKEKRLDHFLNICKVPSKRT